MPFGYDVDATHHQPERKEMKRVIADAISISLAAKVLEAAPSLLLCSKAIDPSVENAAMLADFIKQLAERLQADTADELVIAHVSGLIKSS
ncbi:hypothetical protein [Chromobacterium subtsugae]|nr:hypothetical protein [Chromobacterium subtsugae]